MHMCLTLCRNILTMWRIAWLDVNAIVIVFYLGQAAIRSFVHSDWIINRLVSAFLVTIHISDFNITVTSRWARWRLKSPASRLFTQSYVQAQIKGNIKAPRHWPCEGNSPVTGEFPAQRASNAENVSIWWRHHAGRLFNAQIKENTKAPRHLPMCGEFTGDRWIPRTKGQ